MAQLAEHMSSKQEALNSVSYFYKKTNVFNNKKQKQITVDQKLNDSTLHNTIKMARTSRENSDNSYKCSFFLSTKVFISFNYFKIKKHIQKYTFLH
jgi:hypothetical protein